MVLVVIIITDSYLVLRWCLSVSGLPEPGQTSRDVINILL
jgi:hypothetical protein